MSTPTESTTTFSGKRCTRSLARTLSSTSTAAAASSTTTTSTTTSDVQVQPSAAETSAAAPPAAASSTSTSSTVIGTTSNVSLPAASSAAASSSIVTPTPSPPAAAAPNVGVAASATQASARASAAAVQAPTTSSTTTTSSSGTTSDSITAAASSISTDTATSAVPAESSVQTPIIASQISASPSDQISTHQPQSTSITSGGSAGIISPNQGGTTDGGGVTVAQNEQTNVGGVVGGVFGSVAGLVLISALIFFYLKKKRAGEPFEIWQQRMSEKGGAGSGLTEKIQAIPVAVSNFVAKLRGKKAGPAQNPYRRHSARSSVSSVYSQRSNGRNRSISEPPTGPSGFRQQLRDIGGRMPSLKRSKTLLAKKQDSIINGSNSPFPGIVDDPVVRRSGNVENPFVDPEPLEAPPTLRALNPDANSAVSTPQLERGNPTNGLADQQRPPRSPKPVAALERSSRDPFASLLDEIEEQNGSGTPEWLRDPDNQRAGSATTALRSNPASYYTNSVYTNDNPFKDPSGVPPVPSVPLPPDPPLQRPSNAYNGMQPSRESNTSFFFGEPGPSRPTTMNTSYSLVPRVGRQSDPFDLDRPEVLGYGSVAGRREVRGSVTRQNSKNKRRSDAPTFGISDDGPYGRASVVSRKASLRR